jgi:hypothetical protein
MITKSRKTIANEVLIYLLSKTDVEKIIQNNYSLEGVNLSYFSLLLEVKQEGGLKSFLNDWEYNGEIIKQLLPLYQQIKIEKKLLNSYKKEMKEEQYKFVVEFLTAEQCSEDDLKRLNDEFKDELLSKFFSDDELISYSLAELLSFLKSIAAMKPLLYCGMELFELSEHNQTLYHQIKALKHQMKNTNW